MEKVRGCSENNLLALGSALNGILHSALCFAGHHGSYVYCAYDDTQPKNDCLFEPSPPPDRICGRCGRRLRWIAYWRGRDYYEGDY